MIRKNNLRSLLYKSFLNTSLIPLVVIELTLLVLYFSTSNIMVTNSQDSLSKEIKNNLETILQKESQYIQYQLNSVSQSANLLKNEQEDIFKNKDNYLKILKKPLFEKAPNGVLYKKDNSGASLFYAANTKTTKEVLEKAHFTEAFDRGLKYTVDNSELIVAAYFNSYDNMNRLYPYIPDVYSQFDPNINMEDYNFYYEADQEHNPNKKAVWTDAYLDPAGQGWMLSCIVPIYNNNKLEGVTGLDVTIDKFIKNILDLDLPWNAKAFMVNDEGTILAMPQELEEIFGLKELKSHNYTNTITETKLKPEDFNIYKNPKLSSIFKDLQNYDNFLNEITIDEKEYLLAQSKITQTNWKLYVLVDESIVFRSVSDVKELSMKLGFYAILGMLIFYVAFFIFLYNKVLKISKNIADPISDLAIMTQKFGADMEEKSFKKVDIVELDTLSNNFNQMTVDLHKKTTLLENLNNTLEKRVEEEVEKNRQKDQKLFQQSRLAQMGEMLNMIAHQWRQPLNTISVATNNMMFKILLDEYDKEFFEKETKLISKYSQHLSKTIDDFRSFFKENQEKSQIELNEIVNRTLNIVEPSLQNKNIELRKELKSEDHIKTYVNELHHVILNVLRNSEFAIQRNGIENGYIQISTDQDDKNFYITVKDNGGGIPKNIIDKVFDPYFSTKKEKEGTGLGLYMSKTIIEEHCGGTIEITSEDNTTTLKIVLPRKSEELV